MNSYETVMAYLNEGMLKKMSVAVMAIIFWVTKSFTMSNSNLESVMTALGSEFSFNTSTAVLTVNSTTYTIYQMIEYSIENLYKKVDVITYLAVSSSIKFSYDMEYITAAERATLKDLLNAA